MRGRDGTPRPRSAATRRLAPVALVAAMLVAAPRLAAADAYEASVHVEGMAGLARLSDPLAAGQSSVAPVGGAGVRFTWATRDWLAWEVEAYGLVSGAVQVRNATFRTATGNGPFDFSRGATAIGADAGATLRLGVRFIPTASLAIGPQLRLYPSVPYTLAGVNGKFIGNTAAATTFDLAARASVGFDYRFGRHWIIGVRGSAQHALGLGDGAWDALEGIGFVSYYWYPRWWTF